MFDGDITRRQLVTDLTKLTSFWLSLSSCSSFFKNTEFAAALINDRPTTQLSPVLQSLISTLVPLDEPIFNSLPTSYFEKLIVDEFDIYRKSEFQFYRRALIIFNDTNLFNFYPSQLIRIENESTPITKDELKTDEKNYLKWLSSNANNKNFIQLPVDQKQAYLMLWSQSPLNYKRTFYKASKSLIYAAVYSQEQFTSKLGYLGPTLVQEGTKR